MHVLRRHTLYALLTAACALPACDGGTIDAPLPAFEASGAPQPDIVLITLDTTRADHIGAYGYPRATTPVIDALAAESLLFERFTVPVATTLPVHTSLFTGLEPTEHGVLANLAFSGERFVPPPGVNTLASWLGDQGYTAGGFVSATPLKRATGIAEGFDSFLQPRGFERSAHETIDLALEWLEERAQAPYLLWVHLYDPHHPYEPPLLRRWALRPDATLRALAAERGLGEDQLDTLARYDAELRETDAQVGRLLDSLRVAGRWDRTVVVVAGDHGEGLGQHGVMHHGLIWGEQVHAPLIIHAPGLEPGRHPGLASATDLIPTLLGLVDLPHEQALLDQCSGQDLLAWEGERDAVLSHTSPKRKKEGLGAKKVLDTWAYTTDEWTLHFTLRRPVALYHRPSDPHQLTDVIADEPVRSAAMFTRARAAHADQKRRGRALGAGELAPMDPQMILELEALGYVE
jgi:arylsulfatase A-like enzyme